MTEEQAISLLTREFVSSPGFLAQLREGRGLDWQGVGGVREALDTVRTAWSGREDVPKAALLAFMHFDNALPPYLDTYPKLRSELAKINDEFGRLINESLVPKDPELEVTLLEKDYEHATYHSTLAKERLLTEHEAIEIVQEHIAGGPGLVTSLRMGEGLDREALNLVRTALLTLEQAWEDRICIPKEIAIFLVTIRSAILASQDYYPDLHEELASIADDIADRVMRCLR